MTSKVISDLKFQYPLIYVEWLDSAGINGWHEPDTNDDFNKIISVGWLTNDNENTLTITGHMQVNPRFHHSDIAIPKCSIIKRDILKG